MEQFIIDLQKTVPLDDWRAEVRFRLNTITHMYPPSEHRYIQQEVANIFLLEPGLDLNGKTTKKYIAKILTSIQEEDKFTPKQKEAIIAELTSLWYVSAERSKVSWAEEFITNYPHNKTSRAPLKRRAPSTAPSPIPPQKPTVLSPKPLFNEDDPLGILSSLEL